MNKSISNLTWNMTENIILIRQNLEAGGVDEVSIEDVKVYC
ncbi:MAG: hypothetical protein ACOX89_08580 [Lutispora sp.]